VAPASGGFPVDFIIAVARNVFAKFFEFAAFAYLALGMQAKGTAIQEKWRQALAVGQ
jgi:hypothetical protein